MFVDYAKIIILVKAQDSDVNGPDEIKLSDDVACMEEDLAQSLEKWYGEKFQFEVKVG